MPRVLCDVRGGLGGARAPGGRAGAAGRAPWALRGVRPGEQAGAWPSGSLRRGRERRLGSRDPWASGTPGKGRGSGDQREPRTGRGPREPRRGVSRRPDEQFGLVFLRL